MKRWLCTGLMVAVCFLAVGDIALAADEATTGTAQTQPTRLPRPLAEFVRALSLVLIGLAFGAIVLLVRTILPPLARATDASIARMTTKRLLICGLLPILGSGLLARGLEKLGNKTLAEVYGLVVLLPLVLLAIAGLCAALPHLGRAVLRADREPTPLAAGLAGGLILGLASISSAWEPLAALVGILLASWCLGVGLGTLVRPRNDALPPEQVA